MGIKIKILIVIIVIISSSYLYLKQQGNFNELQTQHKFRIYKDQYGIPRIYAKDKISIFYAMGFAEAQDRLWTLYLRKMIVQGRLCEVFGKDALPIDLQNRNFDFYGIGKMNSKLLDHQQRQLLQAFSDGINDYAKHVRLLPFQFYLTFTKWENWQVQDSMSMLALLSFVLEFDWMYQLARQRLLQTVGFDLAWKIIPFGDDNLFREITIMNNDQIKEQGRYVKYDSRVIEPILRQHWVNKTMPIGSVYMLSNKYDSLGSNAWVVGGEHTKKGKPLLANDPHLGLLIPSLFYFVEFNLLDKNNDVNLTAFGAKPDGFPSLSIGVNNHFGWGSTAAYIDNKDVFHEIVQDNNGTLQYLYKNQWRPFTIRKQVFNIRGQQQYIKQFYHTHRGPVLEHLFFDIHVKYGFPIPHKYRINHTLTFSSVLYKADNESFKGLVNLAFSKTFQQFQQLSSLIQVPNIDSVFITDNGTFGYGAVGRTPIRNIPEMGGFVKDGTTDLYDMGDNLPWKLMPKLRNPKKGFVSMANNKFAEDSFDSRSSIHQISNGRSYRLQKIISQKIKNKQKFTHDDMKIMQQDTKDQFLSQVFPNVLNALDHVRYIWENQDTVGYFNVLKEWDYYMPQNSSQTAIYHVFQHHFHDTLLVNTELANQQRDAILNHAFFEIYLMRLYQKIGRNNLTQEQAIICTNIYSNNYTELHPCLVNVAITFKKLPIYLEQLFGTKNWKECQWSKIHKNVFKSIPWSDIPVLKNIWAREAPVGGNSRSLNVAIFTHQKQGYNSVAGPVIRFITDIDETYYSIDTGESDRITSKYYDNFLGKNMYVKYQKYNPIKGDKVNWKILIDRL